MTISWIWAGMVTAALLCGLFFGTLDAVAAAALSGAQSAVELSLSMAGILCLWSGVMEVLRACGLADKIAALFRPLLRRKMEKAKFVTQIAKQEENLWGEGGFDTVTFTVATNPNSPQGPINKIASGGELARFMLALKVNLAQSSSVETMIFDEVDAGVGGATAQAVGERLSRLAQGVQVLVVTHSPQVAAKGNNHFKVEKNTVDNVTTTNVRELHADEKCEEIARMLAGEKISDEARAAAKVLLSA